MKGRDDIRRGAYARRLAAFRTITFEPPVGSRTVPMPRWWGQINKRVFNPLELRRGVRPVLTHVGHRSGRTYRTPLDAHRVDGGYLFILVYGPESDWVRNVLAAGHARLAIAGEELDLTNPRLVDEAEAWQALPDTVKRPPRLLRIHDYLRMDLA